MASRSSDRAWSNEQRHAARVEPERPRDFGGQFVDAVATQRRNLQRPFVGLTQVFTRTRVEAVGLVEHQQHRHVGGVHLAQHAIHGLHVALVVVDGRVHDVQEQVGVSHFFERRPEGGHQRVRQAVDEARPCRRAPRAGDWEAELTGQRIERDEQRVGGDGAVVGQPG